MIKKMNLLAKKRIPFLFIIDFDMDKNIILPLDNINNQEIMFDIRGVKNFKDNQFPIKFLQLKKNPVEFNFYKKAFDSVVEEMKKGNSFLLNLTFKTGIELNASLKEVFYSSHAKYKLYYRDEFVVFSPEQFVIIKDNKIYSYPMKGTIDASICDAEKIIINDEKEFAEHITIVDLIRNDLGMVARNIKVDKFRYLDKIKTNNKDLLQVSSEISGELEPNWRKRLGDIIYSLLPAGSITGAPKNKCVDIIKNIENYKRGFYTGIFGLYDGEKLDSGVMIRFIEKEKNKFYYKSGGGITIYSDAEKEYNEMLEKIYVPIAGND
ncbi:MAG: aminodeoxychorismate synthase component I [Spirochaetes bacterium]|nr:aminodeoxychorismate synthase component I [Spirochaetota bacterium]